MNLDVDVYIYLHIGPRDLGQEPVYWFLDDTCQLGHMGDRRVGSTIVVVTDQVESTDNLVSWAEGASKRWMGVINTLMQRLGYVVCRHLLATHLCQG